MHATPAGARSSSRAAPRTPPTPMAPTSHCSSRQRSSGTASSTKPLRSLAHSGATAHSIPTAAAAALLDKEEMKEGRRPTSHCSSRSRSSGTVGSRVPSGVRYATPICSKAGACRRGRAGRGGGAPGRGGAERGAGRQRCVREAGRVRMVIRTTLMHESTKQVCIKAWCNVELVIRPSPSATPRNVGLMRR